jgi:periplasmic protein TonB
VVRKSTPAPKPAVEAEDTAGPPPSPLGVASPADSNLKGLMPSEANLAKPTLSVMKISQGVSQGMLIKSVPPKYPRAAVASHLQGDVQIEATITKEGNVLNPKVIKGGPILGEAALEAVRQWRYKPYYLDGQPVQVQTQITVKFKNE